MPPYTIEKQQENTWKIKIVDVPYNMWYISVTLTSFSNVYDAMLVNGNTEVTNVDRVSSFSGTTAVYTSPNNGDKFEFFQYNVSTDTEERKTILFERQFL